MKKVSVIKKNNINKTFEATYRYGSKSAGFAMLDTGEDIYIKVKDSMNAMAQDKVLVEIYDKTSGKSREGKVVKIIKKENDTVVGIFTSNKNYGFVTPINKKIPFDTHIEKIFFNKAVTGSIVEVKILNTNNKGENPEGIITNIIGHKDDPNDEITAIVRDYKVKDTFDKETLDEVKVVAVPLKEKDYKDRIDLRNKTFITIDGDDTKDIDDAICLEKIDDDKLRLYVSIADVSHYVKEGSFLDKEALHRGNSVYLLDRVIPMLPRELSNGMCSLNEAEDRLTLTCEMDFDYEAHLISHKIYKSVINSRKRMTYDLVQDIFDKKEVKCESIIVSMLFDMLYLSRKLRKLRVDRGAINFNLKETYIEVDEKLVPIDIREKKRIESNDLIEDFMVAANETVATHFFEKKVPFLYRSHEKCDDEKIKALVSTLKALAIPFTYRKDISPKDMQNLLKMVEGETYSDVVEKLSLRSMSQAKYTKEALGHFALASKYYSHFTSPIRRYSDLQIHRIIIEVLYGDFDDKRRMHYDSILDEVAINVSKCERVAIDLERDIDDLKKCEFMEDKLGEIYEGTISGLTNFGIFVELENTIEGLVPFRDIDDDHYVYDEMKYQVYGVRKHKIYNFGDKVRVQLVRDIPELREIDFVFV